MKLKINRKTVLILLAVLGGLAALCAAVVFGINGYVVAFGEKYILSPADAAALPDVDCILVLGCKVKSQAQNIDHSGISKGHSSQGCNGDAMLSHGDNHRTH